MENKPKQKPMYAIEHILQEINDTFGQVERNGTLAKWQEELQQIANESNRGAIEGSDKFTPAEFAHMSYLARFEAANLFNLNLHLLGSGISTGVMVAAKRDLPVGATMKAAAYSFKNEYLHSMLTSTEHGSHNQGNMVATMTPVMHTMKKAPTMVFDDDLMKELQLTDLSSNVPCHYIIPPFNMINVQFGNSGSDVLDDEYTVHNTETGYHRLEGAMIHVHNPEFDTVPPAVKRRTGVTENSDMRSIDIMFYARPKATLLDDAVSHFNLTFDMNSDIPLSEVLEEYLTHYLNGDHGFDVMRPETKGEMTRNMHLLARCLVYLNCADCRKVDVKERTDLLRQIKTVTNPKKKRRLEKQLRYHNDFILIKPTQSSPKLSGNSESTHKVSAHWRRGHMRMQRYGEGRSLQKLIHIKPILVGMKSDAKDSVQAKTYKVK